jgi:hypothetical protein
MALDFPSNPTNGQVYDNYYYDSSITAWRSSGSKNGLSQRVTELETYVGGQVLRSSSAQTFAPSAWYLLTDATKWVESSRGGSVSAFNGTWVAPVSGIYTVEAQVQLIGSVTIILTVKKNSTSLDLSGGVISQTTKGISGVTAVSASGEVKLLLGDTLRVAIYPTDYTGSVGWSPTEETSRFSLRLEQRL